MDIIIDDKITDFNEYKRNRVRNSTKKKAVPGTYDSDFGYDAKAVQKDLEIIKALARGKNEINAYLAADIYYKIRMEKIEFTSDIGIRFYDKIIEMLTEEQIRKINNNILQKKQKELRRRKIIGINKKILITLLSSQLIGCLVFLNWNLFMDIRTNIMAKHLQLQMNNADNSQMSNIVVLGEYAKAKSNNSNVNDEKEKTEVSEQKILNKFVTLHDQNPDFSGWLSIDGTKIDYPVMSRLNDNNYYLDKNFAESADKNGLLIMDYRCNFNSEIKNIIIYGHNMRSGVMFGGLKSYKDKAYCVEHPVIEFDSLYEEGKYKIVAAMLSEVAYEDEEVFRYYDAIDISTEDAFNAFRDNIKENAIYFNDELEYGDSCLTLSTCDNYKEDGRFVVIAKKIK